MENQIKVISQLIKKYKLEGDINKVKQLQKIGLDLACAEFRERDYNSDTYWSAKYGEFKTYKRKQ